MKNWKHTSIAAFFTVAVFVFVLAAAAHAQLPLNLSGYEIFRGIPCVVKGVGVTGKCGVKFTGWTGGGGPGPESTNWAPFPGDGQAVWSADISYEGSVGFGNLVTLTDGSMMITLADGTSVSLVISDMGGFVRWPLDFSTDSFGCGAGVAQVVVYLGIGGPFPVVTMFTFVGCLHDLPPGTAVPPKIWGTLVSGIPAP